MSKHGQNNYKGLNFQSWAAMSLFLQHLKKPNFSYIQLEASNYEDFNLVFDDGSKIICESKAYTKDINYSELNTILETIFKKNSITEGDKILIICSNLNKKMAEKVRYVRYYDIKKTFDQLPDIIKTKFTKEIIDILPRVDFWEVKEKKSYETVYALFGELLNLSVWLPQEKIKVLANALLFNKIQYGAATGSTYKKQEIFDEIEKIRQSAIKDSGLFDKKRVKKQKQLENIIKSVKSNQSPTWATNQISAITADRDLMFFALDRFKKEKIDDLNFWDDLWQAAKIHIYSFGLFDIFERNLYTEQNRKYILKFISDNIDEEKSYYSENLFEEQSIKIIKKIIEEDLGLVDKSLEILESLLTDNKDDYFYLKSKHRRDLLYHKNEICKLLKIIYDKSVSFRNDMYKLLISTFNLVEDDGEHSLFTPITVFSILKEHLLSDMKEFENKFMKMKDELAKQYDKYYDKYGRKFKGWELMGGTTAYAGDNIRIDDRHFIKYLLKESLKKYYETYQNKAWKFIIDECLVKEQNVSFQKPDFLNRTCIPFIIEKYFSDDPQKSEVAFGWLREFIITKKGIPHKSDLVYQELYNKYLNTNQTDKLWKLVKIGVDRYELPISPFLDKIVTDLVKNRHKESIEVIKQWLKNSKYQTSVFHADRNFTKNIRNLIEIDFDLAIYIFTEFINTDFFINKYDDFDVYDIAGVLNKIIVKNPDDGLKILKNINDIEKYPTLSKNQQILLTNSILNYKEGDKNKPEILEKIYKIYVDPLLKSFTNDIDNIIRRFTFSHARESLVKFAEALAMAKDIDDNIGKALRIVKVFINDPDPYFPGKDPEDPEDEYNEHKKVTENKNMVIITSVRGWCAQTLRHCATLGGREYIEEIIEVTEKLTKDENYYIKLMSCFPLSQLASNRLSHMPDNKDEMFFAIDKLKALKMAKKVEEIAFNLLEDIVELPSEVQNALAESILSVFNHIRALNEKDALKLIYTLKKMPDEAIAESIPLFVFYSELRNEQLKNWHIMGPGLYDDLLPDKFNMKVFKDILIDMTKNGSPEVRIAIVGDFMGLPRHSKEKKEGNKFEEAFKLSIEYLTLITEKYEHRAFEYIYMFIKEFFNEKSNECLSLWEKATVKEKEYITANKEKAQKMSFWLYQYHGEVLVKIKEVKGDDKFLEWFKFLSEYPKEIYLGDFNEPIKYLIEFPKDNKLVEKIFDNLVERNSSFYDKKQEWLKKN